jgi:hypothetical protein
VYQETDNSIEPKKVEYTDVSNKDMSQYSQGSMFAFKDRPDMSGSIKRIEDGQIVFNMFEHTYKMPEDEFNSIFFINHAYSPQNWYTRIK